MTYLDTEYILQRNNKNNTCPHYLSNKFTFIFSVFPLVMAGTTMIALKGLRVLFTYHVIGTFFYARASPD